MARTSALAWTVVAAWALARSASGAPADTAELMPVAQQNALVQKYCATCHNDKGMAGGLSLAAFDAAHPDPNVAGMMVSKLNGGAMGAAGIVKPDPPVVEALTRALAAAAVTAQDAAGGWTLKSFNGGPRAAPLVTATMRQEAAAERGGTPGVYEMTATCEKISDTAKAQIASFPASMRLAVFRTGEAATETVRPLPQAKDNRAPFLVEIDGQPAAAIGYAREASGTAILALPLPSRSMTIRDAFPGEMVTFHFDRLSGPIRHVLSSCVASD